MNERVLDWQKARNLAAIELVVYIEKYQSFRNKFELVPGRGVSLIIGRNDSGKTSLLKLYFHLASKGLLSLLGSRGWSSHVLGKVSLQPSHLAVAFRSSPDAIGKAPESLMDFISQLDKITVRLLFDRDWNLTCKVDALPSELDKQFWEPILCQSIVELFRMKLAEKGLYQHRHYINYDRNPVAQRMDSTVSSLQGGSDLNKTFARIAHSADYASQYQEVKSDFLWAMSTIMGPDFLYDNFDLKLDNELDFWEIVLLNAVKELHQLSKVGTGLQTVAIIAFLTQVYKPIVCPKEPQAIFIDEIESHLHPRLLRRLLDYMLNHAATTGDKFFMTSHSATAIDMLYGRSDVLILNVQRDSSGSTVSEIKSASDLPGMLDSLGARPSDVLQANGVIWVEGPTDRIYLNHWIGLVAPDLREGSHYQLAFYGGSLSKHVEHGDLRSEVSNVNLTAINRNYLVITDSDEGSKNNTEGSVARNMRVNLGSAASESLLVWEARSIENYIPKGIFEELLRVQPAQMNLEKDTIVIGASSNLLPGLEKPKISSKQKVWLAQKVCALSATAEEYRGKWDWKDKMDRIVKAIREWNDMGEGEEPFRDPTNIEGKSE